MSLMHYKVPTWSTFLGATLLEELLPANLLTALALILAGSALSQIQGNAPTSRPLSRDSLFDCGHHLIDACRQFRFILALRHDADQGLSP